MNCDSCDICVYHLGLFVFFPGVFLSSRVTGPCPVTTDLIMRVNVRTTTGDSAEEFIPIHALVRERLLVLSCGLPSHPVFARWETIELLSQFSTHQPPNVILTEA